jgi:2'-5' RNA ligase
MKRLFVAVKIEPGENFLKVYYSLKKELQNEKIKWVEPQNMHITLKFFGETPEQDIEIINNVLAESAKLHSAFAFSIKNTGIFGSRYNPKVIWFGINNQEKLQNLGLDILSALDVAGFKRDRQNFVPHLTVGRIKYLTNKNRFQKTIDKYKDLFLQDVNVGKFTLYESVLKPTGPVYYPLDEFYLSS